MTDRVPAIEVQGLTKRYGGGDGSSGVMAVDHVSFRVESGELFGFLGPNGAGKTTTIRMLIGLTRPTSGGVAVAGLDVADRPLVVKERIGVVSDVASPYAELSAWDNLSFVARLHGMSRHRRMERAEEMLRFLGLYDIRHRPTMTYSTGQRKRLMLALALIHEPQILFLDEPTTGLDVQSARRIRKLLRELNDRGVTVFLTTHYVEEADELCGRIAIINQGRIVAVDTAEALKSRVPRREVIEVTFDGPADGISGRLRELGQVDEVIVIGERVRLYAQDPSQVLPPLMDLSRETHSRILALNTTRPSLEDAFVLLTGLDPEAMGARGGTAGPGSRAQRG